MWDKYEHRCCREERRHLERTLSYIREGKNEKFMSLDEFERKLNLK
jgi:hypothetical protein